MGRFFNLLIIKPLRIIFYPIILIVKGIKKFLYPTKVYSKTIKRDIIIRDYSIDTLWNFITNFENYKKWSSSFDIYTKEETNTSGDKAANYGHIFFDGEMFTYMCSIAKNTDEHSGEKRLTFEWENGQIEAKVEFHLLKLENDVVITKKRTYKTIGWSRFKMYYMLRKDVKRTDPEFKKLKKILNTMFFGRKILSSIKIYQEKLSKLKTTA